MKRNKRNILNMLLAVSLIAGSGVAAFTPRTAEAAGSSSSSIQILLDGYPLATTVSPVIIQNTTLVPFRTISEALGVSVTWNASNKTIQAVKEQGGTRTEVLLTLDSKQAVVNGKSVSLTVAPRSISGSTVIPLSFFSQQFGAQVQWDQATKTVSITSPKRDMYTLGFYALSSVSDAPVIPTLDAVAFGWSRIDENGTFTQSGKDFKLPQPLGEITADSLIADASEAGTTPYLMVYSSDVKGELTKIVENAEARQQAISDMIAAAKDKEFSGILLDFEGLGLTTDKAATRSSFNAFVKQLAQETRASGLKLALALHPLNSSYQGYDYKTLGKLADELIIMAYDYQTKSGGSTGDEAAPEPIAKVDEAIRLALQETNKDKLILGLNLHSENAASVTKLIGLAKRYDLKGIALWRLGLISADEWSSLRQSVEFKS
ncbi:stalk domain-containing protein [Paenibacillus apis]|uniref:GH18 domain-containing protein n=1 Tax=Paenibacillus apis TaxID=1792174 RepID=A0A919Y8N1_9BACL|nr:stalk domain-containing protein [Paenibacillus apis]GIO45203.1 hypothetical protein J41TS4_49610 [Paenibacillus apis]